MTPDPPADPAFVFVDQAERLARADAVEMIRLGRKLASARAHSPAHVQQIEAVIRERVAQAVARLHTYQLNLRLLAAGFRESPGFETADWRALGMAAGETAADPATDAGREAIAAAVIARLTG